MSKPNLAKAVFDLYRYKYDSDSKTTQNDLEHEALSFRKLFDSNTIEPEKRYVLITAFTQQGKTFLTIAAACVHLALNHIPILIVKDRQQMRQLLFRVNAEMQDVRQKLKALGFSKEDRERYHSVLYCDSKSTKDETSTFFDGIQEAFSGRAPRFIIAIHHEKHLQRIQNYQNHSVVPSILFIDEAHKLGGYKKLSPEGIDFHDLDISYDTLISAMKERATKIYLITATPQDIMIIESQLYIRSIIWLRCPANYIGIDKWRFARIEPEPATPRESLLCILSELSNAPCIERIDKFGNQNMHPISILSFAERINDEQDSVLRSFKSTSTVLSDEQKTIIDAKWVLMTLNQNGIRLYHETLIGEAISLPNEEVCDYDDSGEFLFVQSQIGDVYHWLAHNGGVDRFPRIVVVAYKSAEEGVTFCSTWSLDKDEDKSWHLTHIDAMGISKSATCSAVEQRIGRVNGNHGDKIQPIIFCNVKCQEKLIKGFNLHFEQVRACCEQARIADCKVVDFVRAHPLFENQIPSRCYAIPGAQWFLHTEYNPDGNMEDEIISKGNSASKILQVVNPNGYQYMIWHTIEKAEELAEQATHTRAKMKEKYDASTAIDDKHWGKLKSAYKKKDKLIRKIIDKFVEDDFESLSEDTLAKVCGGTFQYDNYTRWDTRHYKYHILDRLGNGKFNLRADVIEKLQL